MTPMTGTAPPISRPAESAVAGAALARPDPSAAARALLAALGSDDDALAAVVHAVAGIAGAPAAIVYRREGERLLLAHRHGDGVLADESVAGSPGKSKCRRIRCTPAEWIGRCTRSISRAETCAGHPGSLV